MSVLKDRTKNKGQHIEEMQGKKGFEGEGNCQRKPARI